MSTSKGPTLSVVPIAKGETASVRPQVLQPSGWPTPKGYANGMAADGRYVVTGGVIGWNQEGHLPADFLAQVRQTLSNISAILAEAGARPEHLVRLTWYVVDMEEYLANLKALGQIYRDVFGAHYPAMALVQVVRLVEKAARSRDRSDRGGASLNDAQAVSIRHPAERRGFRVDHGIPVRPAGPRPLC